MRWVVALGLLGLAGCRQLLGFETPAAGDAPVGIDSPDPDGMVDEPVVPAGRKKTITIDRTKVTGILGDFPVWVLLQDVDLQAHAAADGSDIHFTLPNGAFLAYEIQHWDPLTGTLEAWVRLDISSILDPVFDVRYAEMGPAPTPSPATVFSNNYQAVWHLEDATTPTDTLGTHNGTPSNGPTTSSGKLGNGVSFDGVNDKIAFTNTLTGGGAHTFSAWVSVAAPSAGFSSILTVGSANQNQARFLHTKYMNGIGLGFFANDLQNSANIDGAGFKLVHWTFVAGTSRVYVDGVQVATQTNMNNVNTVGTNGTIGQSPVAAFGSNGNALHGTLDEVRISTVARGAGFISTEFANQSSPGTFYSVGPEVIVP